MKKYILFSLLLYSACITKKESIKIGNDFNKGKIVFLTFSIKEKNNKTSLALESTQEVTGVFKKKPISAFPPANCLKILALSKDKEVIDYVYQNNPLHKTIENQNGDWDEINIDNSQFTVRLQLSEKAHFIIINKIAGQTTKTLSRIRIKQSR